MKHAEFLLVVIAAIVTGAAGPFAIALAADLISK